MNPDESLSKRSFFKKSGALTVSLMVFDTIPSAFAGTPNFGYPNSPGFDENCGKGIGGALFAPDANCGYAVSETSNLADSDDHCGKNASSTNGGSDDESCDMTTKAGSSTSADEQCNQLPNNNPGNLPDESCSISTADESCVEFSASNTSNIAQHCGFGEVIDPDEHCKQGSDLDNYNDNQ